MKFFLYKSLLIFFLFLAAFHFSFGFVAKKIKIEISNTFSKDQIEIIKAKLRVEMQDAVKKENYINPEDAKILNKFIEKVKSDLEKNK
jgi:hypothetical protein